LLKKLDTITTDASKSKVKLFSERRKDVHIGQISAKRAARSDTVVPQLAVEMMTFVLRGLEELESSLTKRDTVAMSMVR